jgi:hypothetical protein
MSETNEPGLLSPQHGRWQFSLRQMFAATIGIAIVFGCASWGGWVKSDAVAYLSMAVLAGVFLRGTRPCLLGACAILGIFWLTGALAGLWAGTVTVSVVSSSSSPSWQVSVSNLNLRTMWLTAPLTLYLAAYLRANSRCSFRSLVLSLALMELFIAAIIVYTCGYSTLFELLWFQNRTLFFQKGLLQQCFAERFSAQFWYFVMPWLLGIVFGEIIARRRKPSGGV